MAQGARRLWRALGSTWLAAILIAALLLASLFSSLFPQMPIDPAGREPWLAALSLRYGGATGLFDTLGFFDAYHAPWFLALLAALLLNTLLCTLQRLPRLWRRLTRPPTVTRPEAFYHGFAHRAEWPLPPSGDIENTLVAVKGILARQRYRLYIERQEEAAWASLYAERGRWAQAGTLVSHVGALLLLLAVMARPALGWQARGVTLLPGQVQPIDDRAGLTVRAGSLVVERHPDGQPRDYQVPLAVVLDGSPTVTQTVRLNHPLSHRGVTFHLQGYGPAVRVSTPAGSFPLAFTDGQVQELAPPGGEFMLRVAQRPEGGNLFVEALSQEGAVLGSGAVPDGQEIEVMGTPVTFTLDNYTVWQVSRDPTVGLAVAVGALLLAGVVLSLWVPHRRIWMRLDNQEMQIVGAGDFNGAFTALAEEISQACSLEEGERRPERDGGSEGEADG